MSDRERCPVCDAVLATEVDHAEWKGRTGPTFTAERLYSLCWSRIANGPCLRTPVDWRARALAAEAESDDLDLRLAEHALKLRGLARGLLAVLRVHEEAGEPATWTVRPANWGDGRVTWEVHDLHVRKNGTHGEGLVCQFRPDDVDGTEQDANACVSAAKAGVALAREVLARGGR